MAGARGGVWLWGGALLAVKRCFGDAQLVLLRATVTGATVRVAMAPTLAQLELPGLELSRDRFSAELCVGADAPGVSATSLVPLRWGLLGGVQAGDHRDVFRAALAWAKGRMFPGWVAGGERGSAGAATMKDLSACVGRVAAAAVGRCVRLARTVALRFRPGMRFAVYARVAADPTGRLAQLAGACPGALIFALGLLGDEDGRGVEAGERLLADVLAGRRLDASIDAALDGWAACCASSRSASRRLAEAGGEERARLLKVQRLLIRRAGPLVPTTLLMLPPPVSFAPEDIPRAAPANAAWFELMKRRPLLEDGKDPEATRALSRFVSRHGLSIAQGRESRRGLAAELHAYGALTGRRPGRRTDAAGLAADLGGLRRRLADMRALWSEAGLRGDELRGMEELCFPALPIEDSVEPGLRVTGLRTCKQLVLEAERMRHCVASRMRAALEGAVALYSVELEAGALTVELIRCVNGWTLGEVRGFANRGPSPDELRRLGRWLGEKTGRGSVCEQEVEAWCTGGCGSMMRSRGLLVCPRCGLSCACE